MSSCTSDNNVDVLNKQNSRVYILDFVSDPAISGVVEFKENSNGSVLIEIELINTIEGESYPAQINMGTAVEAGMVVANLTPVSGTTGKSSTTLSALSDGSPINYNSLLSFDGYLSVSLSPNDLGTLVAEGDIGINELTGISKSYALSQVNISGITGSVDFFERRNGEALSVINLNDAIVGETYSAEMRTNDVVATGSVVFTFSTIAEVGDNFIGKTNVANLDGVMDFFGYENVLDYDGHVLINEISSSTIVAQTNVGVNETNQIPQTFIYDVTVNGTTAYVFNGNGLINAENPDLTFVRGNTYIFNMDTTGQPFYIKTIQSIGTTDVYSDGVTGNGNVTGTVEIVVPQTAPDFLYYNSEFEAAMTAVITVSDM